MSNKRMSLAYEPDSFDSREKRTSIDLKETHLQSPLLQNL
jgi:hypothetical protein